MDNQIGLIHNQDYFNRERPYVTDLLVGLPDFAEQLRAAMLRAAGA